MRPYDLVMLAAMTVSLVVSAGCGGTTAADGDSAADGDTVIDGDTSVEPEVYARVVAGPDDLIAGPDAMGRIGDIVIGNRLVRFVIQGAGPARSWIPYGGSLIDAGLAGDDGPGDLLGEVSPMPALIRGFEPETVEVAADGSAGGPARVVATGRDAGIPIVDMAIPMSPKGYQIRTEYELEAGARALKITTRFENPKTGTVTIGDGVVWGNRLAILTPGIGWGLDGIAGVEFPVQFAEAVAGGQAYAFWKEGGPLKVAIDLADILPYIGFSDRVAAGREVSYTRWFAVGADISQAYDAWAVHTGSQRGALEVELSAADPQDAAVRFDVEVLDADGRAAQHAYLAPGNVVFSLSPGMYTVRCGGEGRAWSTPATVTVTAGQTSPVTVEGPATGRVAFTIGGDYHDGTLRERLPAKITVQAGLDASVHAPVVRRVYTASGEGIFLLEPGDYTLTATRGYEYELCREPVTVTAGGTALFDCQLVRSVDTTGWVAGDLHIHTERSIDAIVPVEDRLIQCAAEGIERTPITDHDTITDIDHLVDPLGLRPYLKVTAGDEVSPPWAHTNGYPMTDRDDRPAYYGAPITAGYDQEGNFLGALTNPEIWAGMRSLYQAGIVQINHPEDGSIGYFNRIGYDPLLGVAALEPGAFDGNWDAVELINSGDVGDSLDKVIPDWFSLLNQGYLKAGTAVSDTHTYANPGQARTWLRTGIDNAADIDDGLLVSTIKAMRVQAASGPFVDARIGQAGIGDTAVSADGCIEFSVKVQAPSWMPVHWVKVFRNGEELAMVEQTELSAGVVRLERTFPFCLGEDHWLVAMAGAPETTLAPEGPGQPVLTIANPVFVDVGGDGWTPPGLPDVEGGRAIIERLASMGRLFDPLHHNHRESAGPARRCQSIAGLNDHLSTAGQIGGGRLRSLIARPGRPGTGLVFEALPDQPVATGDIHRYGFGSDAALPAVGVGCARPDLIPTTVLR